MKKRLTKHELRKRAKKIKLVLTDNDGVLTDTGIYYSENGETFRRYSIRDGMGVMRLRLAGIETAIITGEHSANVRNRAERLKMKFLYLGVTHKKKKLEDVQKETGLSLNEIAFIGDDMNDISIIDALNPHSITAAPMDAMPAVIKLVHYVCKQRGGYGAFRDFAEFLLNLRGNNPDVDS
jgi:3-deoxy-D-manno-octulosonate 8-phosphate phosphatase (KDO 8-P phosphatase)